MDLVGLGLNARLVLARTSRRRPTLELGSSDIALSIPTGVWGAQVG